MCHKLFCTQPTSCLKTKHSMVTKCLCPSWPHCRLNSQYVCSMWANRNGMFASLSVSYKMGYRSLVKSPWSLNKMLAREVSYQWTCQEDSFEENFSVTTYNGTIMAIKLVNQACCTEPGELCLLNWAHHIWAGELNSIQLSLEIKLVNSSITRKHESNLHITFWCVSVPEFHRTMVLKWSTH